MYGDAKVKGFVSQIDAEFKVKSDVLESSTSVSTTSPVVRQSDQRPVKLDLYVRY